MELLRFATAGSVDDGKSTLIGRLLLDSKQIFEDQLEAVERSSRDRGYDYTNLALLTDGLRAEREQGITIDVAYRYFATPRRKFIIADTPGHVHYTRNMVTGASTADLALILIDARNGLREQSRRHAVIASLLRVKHLVVCVNKMDLVDYDEEVFNDVRDKFSQFAERLEFTDLTFIPISALEGDNVVSHSQNMSWYGGATLLWHLENAYVASDRNLIDPRFPVQYVIRPMSRAYPDYRGYAGRVEAGVFRPGDEVLCLPSGFTTTIQSIEVLGESAEEGRAEPVADHDTSRPDRHQSRRHDLPAGQPTPQRTRHRRHGVLVQRPSHVDDVDLHDQAHHSCRARPHAAPPVPARHRIAPPGRDGGAVGDERDRPGHAAHDAAAVLRSVPQMSSDGQLHSCRRSDQ